MKHQKKNIATKTLALFALSLEMAFLSFCLVDIHRCVNSVALKLCIRIIFQNAHLVEKQSNLTQKSTFRSTNKKPLKIEINLSIFQLQYLVPNSLEIKIHIEYNFFLQFNWGINSSQEASLVQLSFNFIAKLILILNAIFFNIKQCTTILYYIGSSLQYFGLHLLFIEFSR